MLVSNYCITNDMDLKIILTEDGSHTLSIESMNEHYHSTHGAVSESMHIYINAGLKNILPDKKSISILEIGFGTGLNALLTLKELINLDIFCDYTTVDNFPLPEYIYSKLNYPEFLGMHSVPFNKLHESRWNEKTNIHRNFLLYKMNYPVSDTYLNSSCFDLVYFDAFGPDKQAEMWTEEIFMKIYFAMKPGGILLTYSTKGNVKRILKDIGFVIEKLPGPLGKREILRAKKQYIKLNELTD